MFVSVRTGPGRQRHVQLAIQPAPEADVAGGMQHRLHYRRRGGENVEFSCCK